MLKRFLQTCGLLALPISLCFAADVVTAVHGTVTKLDSGAKTIAVKTKEGTEHVVHFVDTTTVHGVDAAAKDTFKGVKKGSEVVVHFTTAGVEKTAVEVDKIGKGGMKSTEGAVSAIDRDAKTIGVKTKDGTVETFKIADHATDDAGKDIVKGSEKAAKVTVYYTEESGKKIAHFFERN
jgi:hypothetical protein